MWNILVFAVIGLFTGASARMLYPRREAMHILGTLVLGAIGAVIGGMISWGSWPEVENQFQSGNLIVSVVGATVAIIIGACIIYGEVSLEAGTPHDIQRETAE